MPHVALERGVSEPTNMHAEASLNRRLVLFAKQLETYLAHFPNAHKYTLSQGIRQAFLDVYCLCVEAQKRYHKKTTLGQLDVRHEQLRMMINLAFEMGLFAHQKGKSKDPMAGQHRYLTLSRMCDEIGRMIGGWIQKEFRRDADKSSGREPAGAVGA
jgi:hypothetical protein